MSDSDATTIPPSPTTTKSKEGNNVQIPFTNVNVNVNSIRHCPSEEKNTQQLCSFHQNPSPYTNKRNEKLPSIRSLLPYLEHQYNTDSISPDNFHILSSVTTQTNKTKDKSSKVWIYPQTNVQVISNTKEDKISLPPIKTLFKSIKTCHDDHSVMPSNKLVEICMTRTKENQANSLNLTTYHQHQIIQTPRTPLYLCLPIRKPLRGRKNTYMGRMYNNMKHIQPNKTNENEGLYKLEETKEQLAFVQNVLLSQSSFCGHNRKRNSNTRSSSCHVVDQRLNRLMLIPVKSQQLCKSIYLCNIGGLLTKAFDKKEFDGFEMMLKEEERNLLSPFCNHPFVNMSWNGYEFLKSLIQQSTSCNKFMIDSFSTVCQGIQLQFVKCLKRDRSNRLLIQLIEQISIQIRMLYDTVIYEKNVSLEWGSIISNSFTVPLLMLVDSTTSENHRNDLKKVVIGELQKVMKRMFETRCLQKNRSNENMNDMMMIDQICRFVEMHSCLVQFFSNEELKIIEKDCHSNTLVATWMFVINRVSGFLND